MEIRPSFSILSKESAPEQVRVKTPLERLRDQRLILLRELSIVEEQIAKEKEETSKTK